MSLHKSKTGRRRKSISQSMVTVTTVHLTQKQAQKLNTIADRRERSAASIVREFVEAALSTIDISDDEDMEDDNG